MPAMYLIAVYYDAMKEVSIFEVGSEAARDEIIAINQPHPMDVSYRAEGDPYYKPWSSRAVQSEQDILAVL